MTTEQIAKCKATVSKMERKHQTTYAEFSKRQLTQAEEDDCLTWKIATEVLERHESESAIH